VTTKQLFCQPSCHGRCRRHFWSTSPWAFKAFDARLYLSQKWCPAPGRQALCSKAKAFQQWLKLMLQTSSFSMIMHVFIKKYALHHFTCDFTIYFTIDMCRFRTSCGFPTVGMLISPMPAALRLQRSGRVWNWTVVPSDVSLSTQFLHAQAPYPVLTSATFISKFERCCWRFSGWA
jgi:hypothetical protein